MPEIGSLFIRLGADTAQFDRAMADIPLRAEVAGNRASRGLEKGSKGFNTLGESAKSARFAVTNLSFQLNDVFTSLASGARPTQVFAQQFGQVVQVFQQGGGFKNVLGATATALRGLITPARLLGASLVGVGAGLVFLAERSATATESARKFDVVLRRIGVGGRTTGDDLEGAAKRLRNVGLSASDAREKLRGLLTSGFSAGRAEDVARTGQNFEALFGQGGSQKLTDALSGGLQTTIDLGLQIRALSVDEAQLYLAMARTGSAAEAQALAFDKIKAAVQGVGEELKGPFAKAMSDVKRNWADALDKLSNTAPIVALARVLENAGRGLSRLLTWDFSQHAFANAVRGPVVASAPIPSTTGGTAAAAAAEASGMVGLHERSDRSRLAAYIASGGGNLSDIDVAWCAAFANAALARQGISGTGKNIANSFLNWGSAVTGAPEAGDVLVLPKGRGANQTGGHVGFATGQTKGDLWEMVSGNEGDQVAKSWVRAGDAVARRANIGNMTGAAVSGGPLKEEDLRKTLTTQEEISRLTKLSDTYGRLGLSADQARIGIEAEKIALDQSLEPNDAAALKTAMLGDAIKQLQGQQVLASQATTDQIEGINAVTASMDNGEAAANRMEASVRAAHEAIALFGRNENLAGARGAFAVTRSGQLYGLSRAQSLQSIRAQGFSDQKTTERYQLEASLVGQTTDDINRQVDLLKVKQDLLAAEEPLTSDIAKARFSEVNALNDAAKLLSDRKELFDDLKEAARTMADSFTDAFDSMTDGTFKLRTAIANLAKDLARLLMRRGFDKLIDLGLGSLGSSLFGGGSTGDYGGGGAAVGVADVVGNATGGSWRVGGSGAIDSQLVAMRASPGELIDVSNDNSIRSGGGEVIRLELNPNHGWIADVADRQIRTRAGTIVQVAVTKSQQNTRRNFNTMAAESTARQG